MTFSMTNDGFRHLRTGNSLFDYRHYLMHPMDLGVAEPFGLVAQWEYLGNIADVSTNVTHLTVTLPANSGLTLAAPGAIRFVFSKDETLRVQAPALPAEFEISVTATPVDQASRASRSLQAFAAVVSAMMLPLPLDPGMLDVQATVIIASSVCTQSTARSLGLAGRRVLYPTLDPDDPLEAGLWHSVVMTLSFAALHLLVVYAVMQRYECSFVPAAAKSYFPSLTLAAAALLLPGIINASFTLLFAEHTTPFVRMGCIFTAIYGVVAVVVPVVQFRKMVQAEARMHYDILFEFPVIIRYMLPAMSWGPDAKIQSWMFPFGAVQPKRIAWVTAHLACTTTLSLIFAVAPNSPQGCSVQYVFALFILIAYVVAIAYAAPFRSAFLNISSAVTSASMTLPVLISLLHCYRRTDNTGDVVTNLFSLTHSLIALRLVVGGASHAIDVWLLKPTIWPDAAEGMITERVGASTQRRKPRDEEDEGAGRDDEDEESEDGFIVVDDGRTAVEEELRDVLRTWEAQDERARQEAADREALHQLSEEQREKRLAFGPPDPLPVRPVPQYRRGAQTNAERELRRALLGEPLLNVHRMHGPMPPGLQHRLSSEYDRL
jgi:hypothetical protein